MDTALVLSLVKASLGMTTSFRDDYMTRIIQSIITDLTDEKGIALEPDNANHLMFVVDMAAWRFTNKDDHGGMPQHLHYRLRNLMIHNGGNHV